MKELKQGLHLELTNKGLIFYLTAENEQMMKGLLLWWFSVNDEVYIYETGETLKLEDIFNT